MRQAGRQQGAAIGAAPGRGVVDLIARCEGAQYLVIGVTDKGAAFVRKAPATIPRRDGGVIIDHDTVAEMIAAFAERGMIVRRIEQ